MNRKNLMGVMLGLGVGSTACGPQFEPCGKAETDYVQAVASMLVATDLVSDSGVGKKVGEDVLNALGEIAEGDTDILCSPEGTKAEVGDDGLPLEFKAGTDTNKRGPIVFNEAVLSDAMALYPLESSQVGRLSDVTGYLDEVTRRAITECLSFEYGENLALCNGPIAEMPVNTLVHEVLHKETGKGHSDAFYEAAYEASQCKDDCGTAYAISDDLEAEDYIYVNTDEIVRGFEEAVGYNFLADYELAKGVYDECFYSNLQGLHTEKVECEKSGGDPDFCQDVYKMNIGELGADCTNSVADCL